MSEIAPAAASTIGASAELDDVDGRSRWRHRTPLRDLDLETREALALTEIEWLLERQGRTLGEIGEHLGLSRERVRQIQARALARLKVLMRGAPTCITDVLP